MIIQNMGGDDLKNEDEYWSHQAYFCLEDKKS